MFRTAQWSFLLIFSALAAPVRAAELDKFLPADTEAVVTVNVKQILGSELVKKAGLDRAKQALKSVDMVSDILLDLGFDPFKDLERVTVAGPGGPEKDRGLLIARGNFDVAKFKAKAEDAAKTNPDSLKIHKVPAGKGGPFILYETPIPEQDVPLFVAIASRDVLLASPGKDYLVDALKKIPVQKAAPLRNKEMQALLEKMDVKQSLSVAALASALRKDPNFPEAVKTSLDKLDGIGGGIMVTDGIKLQVVLSAKSAEAAKEIDTTISNALTQGLAMVAFLAGQNKDLAPLVDVFKTISSNFKGKLVTIKAEIGADILDKALGKDK